MKKNQKQYLEKTLFLRMVKVKRAVIHSFIIMKSIGLNYMVIAYVFSKIDSSETKGNRIYNIGDSLINVIGNAFYEKKQDSIRIVADTIDYYKKNVYSNC